MRVVVLALAVVAAAWYVVGIRQAQGINRASAIVSSSGHLSAAQARRASQQLRSAAFLNPDRQVAVLRARLLYDRGDLSGARAILKRIVLSEPDNLQAWILLARASVGDLKDFYAAAFRIRQLVPPVPPPP
jgi:predicted Zn-dependent protease